jgi:hypothetical protein
MKSLNHGASDQTGSSAITVHRPGIRDGLYPEFQVASWKRRVNSGREMSLRRMLCELQPHHTNSLDWGLITLDLTAAEVFEISRGAASLPGRWSAISQCTNDGITYAGLIDPEENGRVAVLIARDIEGLYVARASGEVVARGCASVTDALTAVRWLLRQA